MKLNYEQQKLINESMAGIDSCLRSIKIQQRCSEGLDSGVRDTCKNLTEWTRRLVDAVERGLS